MTGKLEDAGRPVGSTWCATDPLIHEFARRLGSQDYDQLDQHIRSLEREADGQAFLSLNEAATVDAEEDSSGEPSGIREPDGSLPDEGGEVGPYRLVRLLGTGGFSRVYEGYHCERPHQGVAIKLFQHRWLDALERLEIEKLVLQKLRHPNLVRALDSGQTAGGLSYLVLSLVEGQRIDEYVRAHRLKAREVAELFSQLAEALAYAHSQDVVHRDLKPNNILVSSTGIPVIADFGLAKRLRLPIGQSVTVSGALVGTLGYVAPEQVGGQGGEVTRSADIYGLGAALYSVLTGRAPTESENLLRGLQQLQQVRPVAPRSLNPEVPLELQLICLKCLEKSPHDRYGGMEELAEDLKRFVAGRPVAARPPSAWRQFWRWTGAHPTIAALIAGILLVASLGFVVAVLLWQQAESRRQQADRLVGVARGIINGGNRMAENSLAQTAGSLEYRYNRLRQSTAFLQDLLEKFPEDKQLIGDLALAYFRLGKVCSRRGMYEEGGRYYQTARAFFGQLAEAEPENAELQFDLFHCWLGEFHVRGSLDPVIDSLPLLQQAHDRIAWLRQQYPEDVRYGDAYVNTLPLVAWRLENDSERKLELLLHAHAEAMLLRSKLPEPCLEWRHAGLTASHIAHQLTEGGRLSEAANWLDKALDLQTEYLELASKDLLEELDCLGMKFQQGQLLVRLGESERGTQLQSEVLERIAVLVKEYPDYYNFQQALEGWSREFQEQSAERLLPASGS